MSFQRSPGGYLSLSETCDLLGISHPTLYRWMKLDPPLPSHQMVPGGRRLFIAAEVEHWVSEFRCIDTTPGEVA